MIVPIALFVYARPDHTRRTVEALLRNVSVSEHDLIIFSDAARAADKASAVEEVRSYLKTLTGFRSVTIHHRSCNYGLAKSIIEGVTEVLSIYERVIVLEDDMVTSPYFLSYMDDALERFANDGRVISVHGYMYPTKAALPEAFFLPGADCWGWGTWRRGWGLFEADGKKLLGELKRRRLVDCFDYDGAFSYSKMLKDQVEGRVDSWAIRWYASAFLADKMTLYPGRSLVQNIGNDASGTHCGQDSNYDVKISATPIDLSAVDVVPSEYVRREVGRFFRAARGSIFLRVSGALRRIGTKVSLLSR